MVPGDERKSDFGYFAGNRLHPLIFAEQIINGVPIIWDLDGKQRCTNAYAFSKNGYKLTKNIRRWCIQYQAMLKDENGREVLDENGFPVAENREFDIRGKSLRICPRNCRTDLWSIISIMTSI